MKPFFYIVLTALLLTSLACSVTINAPSIQTGETQTMSINEPYLVSQSPTRVELQMGAGILEISGGATTLVEGTVLYNIDGWKPTITRESDRLKISQDTKRINVIPGDKPINNWKLKLGTTPIDLTLRAGAYEGRIDLSGVPLTDLEIADGASTSKVVFNTLNPVKMNELSYKTGASTVELSGLANANFSKMTFEGGAGSYILDFSGKLQQDTRVTIRSGVSDTTIKVPTNVPCKVTVTGGLNTVSISGSWNADSTGETKVYTTSGEGYKLTIEVEMGVGSLKLVNR